MGSSWTFHFECHLCLRSTRNPLHSPYEKIEDACDSDQNNFAKPTSQYKRFLYVLLASFLFEMLIFLDPEFLQTEDTTSLSNSSLLPKLYVACFHLKENLN